MNLVNRVSNDGQMDRAHCRKFFGPAILYTILFFLLRRSLGYRLYGVIGLRI